MQYFCCSVFVCVGVFICTLIAAASGIFILSRFPDALILRGFPQCFYMHLRLCVSILVGGIGFVHCHRYKLQTQWIMRRKSINRRKTRCFQYQDIVLSFMKSEILHKVKKSEQIPTYLMFKGIVHQNANFIIIYSTSCCFKSACCYYSDQRLSRMFVHTCSLP